MTTALGATMIFRSAYDDLDLPDVDLTTFVLRRAAELGDKPAVIDAVSGRRLTYADIAQGIERLAAGLRARGLGAGSVVGVLAPNVPEYPVLFHGSLRAGCAVTTVNPVYRAEEIAHQLRDSGAQLLFTVAAHAEKAAAAVAAAGEGVREIVVIDDDDAPLRLEDVLADGSVPAPEPDAATAVAALPYSSGTTGLPKGVMLSHRNLLANVLQTHASQQLVEDDVVMAVLPFFHIYGMTVTMNYVLWVGATMVTVAQYDRETFPETLERQEITRLYAVPPIILGLAKRDDLRRWDLSRLRGILSGAAPLDGETAARAGERIGCRVVQGYGMTELSPCTHLTPFDDERAPAASIGPALPSTECRIVDPETGKDVGVGGVGELWIRGPQVMLGYLSRPEATRETVDEDGFLHTGDMATVDEGGYYYIVDRLKELIKFKGFQIAPAELEAVLVGHPAVADAAVIGIQDESAGEIPKAVVVAAPGADADEIMAYVAERVAPHKRIRRLAFVDAIPRSASGKILRRELRDAERRAAVADGP